MNVRKHVDKHIEIDVGEFSFQNIIVYIFILLGLNGTVMVYPALLPEHSWNCDPDSTISQNKKTNGKTRSRFKANKMEVKK